MDLGFFRLTPLMLDWLGPDYVTKEELSLRGYDVPCYPFSVQKYRSSLHLGRSFSFLQVNFRTF